MSLACFERIHPSGAFSLLSIDTLSAKKISNCKTCRAKAKQLEREIRVTDKIQRQVEKANATQLKSFRLHLEMEDLDLEVSAA